MFRVIKNFFQYFSQKEDSIIRIIMKELRHYLKLIKRYDFLNVLHSAIFRRPPSEIELRPKQHKFLELGPLSRKKCFIQLPLEGKFAIVNRHPSLVTFVIQTQFSFKKSLPSLYSVAKPGIFELVGTDFIEIRNFLHQYYSSRNFGSNQLHFKFA